MDDIEASGRALALHVAAGRALEGDREGLFSICGDEALEGPEARWEWSRRFRFVVSNTRDGDAALARAVDFLVNELGLSSSSDEREYTREVGALSRSGSHRVVFNHAQMTVHVVSSTECLPRFADTTMS
ncbi:MAG TPA: hypothetical protein VFZ83_04925 [Acidimicrobiia bacterium]|nr:hypothetical protein [Acidimicrobiia bacterium]